MAVIAHPLVNQALVTFPSIKKKSMVVTVPILSTVPVSFDKHSSIILLFKYRFYHYLFTITFTPGGIGVGKEDQNVSWENFIIKKKIQSIMIHMIC